jgi:hypothetical protein
MHEAEMVDPELARKSVLPGRVVRKPAFILDDFVVARRIVVSYSRLGSR